MIAANDERVNLHMARAHAAIALEGAEKEACREEIRALLKARNAVLVAHYYTHPDVQQLAEDTGGCVSDSLQMARFGKDHAADMLVVAGVRFMGETAKILSPEKRIVMPTLEATCSLDVRRRRHRVRYRIDGCRGWECGKPCLGLAPSERTGRHDRSRLPGCR